MTEAEWLEATDTVGMASALQGVTPSDRKLRLFWVACCRLLWDRLTLKAARDAVEAAEWYADRLAPEEALRRVNLAGFVRFSTYSRVPNLRRAARDPRLGQRISAAAFAIDTATGDLRKLLPVEPGSAGEGILKETPPSLVRCVFGNPFRPVTFTPEWRTPTVVSLAEAMYRSRAFDRLPILADALEEAGCDNQDILQHCREDGPHAKGCWVVDLVLGKS